jgi:hypothetical protein
MKRDTSIEALIRRSRESFADLKKQYEASLHEQKVREDLKVDIKNIFENLRSCLDYLAHDLFDAFCKGQRAPDRLYFPIRSTAAEFGQVMARDYPTLERNCKPAYDSLEAAQPYRDPWLGQFNKLNNENKHQNLVEQTRTETRRVEVKGPGGGGVSWGPGVHFGSGVSVMGVPIDPKTQLPVPNNQVTTTVTTWVDFTFKEVGESVLPFIEKSISRVDSLYRELAKQC